MQNLRCTENLNLFGSQSVLLAYALGTPCPELNYKFNKISQHFTSMR